LILLIVVMSIAVSAQTQVNQVPTMLGDWFVKGKLYFGQSVYPSFKYYSQADLDEFKAKVEQLQNAPERNSWDGVYSSDLTEVGLTQLRVKMGLGFVDFYVYSCIPELRALNYGDAQDTGDTIILTTQTTPGSPRILSSKRYVKVTWGDRHYLVEESSLRAFAEKAAGVFVEPEDSNDQNFQRWANYWISGDTEALPDGLPVLPKIYEGLMRLPIKAVVSSVSAPETRGEIQLGNSAYYNAHVYTIAIDKGELDGVKKGMLFRHCDDDLVITSTRPRGASGLLVRSKRDDGSEQCGSDETSQCLKLTRGIMFSTPRGEFHW